MPQDQISFSVSREEYDLIAEIVQRARTRALDLMGEDIDKMALQMDVTACHANGNPLRLADLRDAPDTDFIHDVFGIRAHLNRETGKLMNCFVPRFSG